MFGIMNPFEFLFSALPICRRLVLFIDGLFFADFFGQSLLGDARRRI